MSADRCSLSFEFPNKRRVISTRVALNISQRERCKFTHSEKNGMKKCTADINETKSSAIADKPRDALCNMQWHGC